MKRFILTMQKAATGRNRNSGLIKSMQPNFLIVGAARSGTTSLYLRLRQHPVVFMLSKAETLGQFIKLGSELVRPDEEAWLRVAKEREWGGVSLSSEARLRLRLQELVNSLLSNLMNGTSAVRRRSLIYWINWFFSRPGWWRGSLSSEEKRLLEVLRLMATTTNARQYLDVGQLVELLKRSEEILSKTPSDIPVKTVHVKVSQEIRRPDLAFLHEYCAGMDEFFSLYIHGSKATDDDTPFSDIDDILIVHREAWKDRKGLEHAVKVGQRVCREFQNVDPLQHHGHWVYSDLDLGCFNESIMPLLVLRHARIVCGRKELNIRARANPAGVRKILWTIIQEVRRDTLAAWSGNINLYWLKNLVSGISLLPALTFQTLGQMIDKKSAILKAHEIYSEQACEAIHWASEVRKNWANMPTYSYLPLVKFTVKILAPKKRHIAEIMARKLLPPIPTDRLVMSEKTFHSILTLADESAERLKEVVLYEVR